MRIKPAKSGGCVVEGDTPHGRFHVEWKAPAHGEQCKIVTEDGRVVGTAWIEIRKPDHSKGLGDTVAKATKAVGIKPCGGCKKRQRLLNRLIPYK